MKSKRNPSCVSSAFLFSTLIFLIVFTHVGAQSYKKHVSLNDSLVQFTMKKTFEHAGDKLMMCELSPDTENNTQLFTVKLLNPDFSLFKSFSRVLPIETYVMYAHNGVDVLELEDGDDVEYYLRYTSSYEDEYGYFGNRVTVLNEASDSLFSFRVSFHGPKTFVNGDEVKIVGESLKVDTFFTEDDEYMYTNYYDVWTSVVYDVKTGDREFTFPKGTQFNRIIEVDGSSYIVTKNNNMELFLSKWLPYDTEDVSMQMVMYNMDYSVHKELNNSFASVGLDMDDINYTVLYDVLSDGHNTYFLHLFGGYKWDADKGEDVFYQRYVMTDVNGTTLSVKNDEEFVPSQALWLPSKGETIFMNYNGDIISFAEWDSIGHYTDYTIQEDGSVLFVNVQPDSIRFMNEHLEVVASIPFVSEDWHLGEFSRYNVVADSLMELVFSNDSAGIMVLNEKGHVLVDEPEITGELDFMNYSPIFLREEGHKYANLVDDTLSMWIHVAPMHVEVKQGETLLPLSLQMFALDGDSVSLFDTSDDTGTFERLMPEGRYVVRTVSEDLPATYYPAAILWEHAEQINFTTDSAAVLIVQQKAAPDALSPSNEGMISGSLQVEYPESLWAVSPEQVKVYAVQSDDFSMVAVGTMNADLTFELTHLPFGSYYVLIDIPGFPMLSNPSCDLVSGSESEEVLFTVKRDGIEGDIVTALPKQVADRGFAVVPNPASDFMLFDVAQEGNTIELYDMTGRRVMVTNIRNGKVAIGSLPEGLYLVRVLSDKGSMRAVLRKK